MKFQVKNLETNEVSYHDPETTTLLLYDCVLKNQKTTAEKINCGANKTVCAWVRAGHVVVVEASTKPFSPTYEISYNPRVAPFWRDYQGNDIDEMEIGEIKTIGRSLFANPNY